MIPKPVVDSNTIYSRAEAAHVLGVSLTTLKQLIRAGQLVVSHPPGIRRVFIKGSSILEMLERTTVMPERSNQAVALSQSFTGKTNYRTAPVSIAQPIAQPATPWNSRGQVDTLALRSTRDTRARPAVIRAGMRKNPRARGGTNR